MTLTSGATVTQSARIAAAGLNLQGAAGNFVLANPGNAITTLAGNTANASVTDNDGFTIGSVGATDGLTASGNLTLTSIAAVGQTKAINVAGLELLGTGGSFTLDDANNAITTLAGNTGTVSLTENSGFAIGAVNTVGLAATSQLTLSSTGGVTQAERIATPALALLGVGGSYVLNNGANALTTVALDTGSVKLTENSGFAIGSVGSTVGATTSATMSLTSGANVTQTQAISTTGLELLGAGGNFTLTNAGNSIPLLAGSTGDASIQTTGALEIGTVNSAGMGATGNLQLKANGIISQSQALAIGGDLLLQTTHNAGDVAVTNLHNSVLGSTSVGGNYTLTATGMEVTQRASTDVQVRGDINIDAASLVMGGAGNIVGGNTNMPTVAELRQSGMITLGTLGDLNVTGSYSVVSLASNKGYGGAAAVHGDAIVLNSAGNSIGGAIAVTTSGPTVIGGSEVLTGIQQAANSSIHISGTASFTAEASSVPGSGLITLNNPGNTFGSLVVSGSTVSVTETGDTSIGSAVATTGLTLHSTGAVSQTGPVITPLLAIGAANSVALNNANNDVATLAIQTAGAAISYRDANSFAIGSVDSINGIDTGAGAAVNLVAGGAGNITQSQAIVGATTLSASAGGSVLLADAGNTIGTLDAVSAGTGIDINDSTAGLTIGGNLASQGGNVQVHTEGGDLTLADGVTIGAGGSGNLALAAGVGFNFKNAWANTSANPITMGSGRFLIYSTNNSATALGGIAGAGYMGYTFAGNAPAGIGGSDNRILYQDQATLVFTATNQSRLYGDSDPTFTYSVSGLLAGDNLASAFGGLPALSTLLTQGSDVGSGAISIALGSVSSSKGYIFSFTDGVLTINARPVNLSGSRAYDGTVDVGNGIFSINNTYNGETLALTGAGTVGGKNVGSAKAVTTGLLALANGSGKASNYTLVGGTHTADITARVVGVSAAKEYDGGAALNGAVTLSTGVSGEALTYSGATASDANVATIGKYVNAITLADGAGGASANYQLPALDAAHAPVTITPKTVSISATRTYDGSSALAGVVSIATGIGGQALTYSGATAASSHVGAGNYIDAITLADGTGGVASNYQLPSLAAASASNGVTINAATLVASISNSGVSKVYDGTLSASGLVPSYNITGFASGDTGAVLAFTSALYDSAHVASASKVTVSGMSITSIAGSKGSLAGDYVLDAGSKEVAATISARTLTTSVSNTGVSKVYDGGTSAPAGFVPTFSVTGFASGDTGATIGSTGAVYDSAHVASASKVTVSGISLGAVAGANGSLTSDYALDATSKDVAATIAAKTVSLSAAKVYDGDVSLTGTVTVATGITGEALTYSGASAASSHVGAGNYIDAITLANGAGGLATDYQLPSLAAASASNGVTINAATLVASISNSGVSKVYDGTLSASGLTPSYNIIGFASGDIGAVLAFTSALYDSAHVVSASKVTVSGMSITSIAGSKGSLAGDYMLDAGSKEVAATISARTLTTSVSNAGVNKVYDGGTSAPSGFVPTFSVTGFASGDTGATIGSTGAVYDSAHVASASKVTVTGISLGAVAGANGSLTSDYALDATSKDVAATIGAKTVSLSAAKVYDGGVSLSGAVSLATGITGEALSYSGATASDANVATVGKYVSALTLLDGAGGLASDYRLPTLNGANAAVTITPKTVSLSGSKNYDGGTGLAGALSIATGIGGESLSYSGATANSSHVAGASYVDAITLGNGVGGTASNYQLPALNAAGAGNSFSINPATLVTTFTNTGVTKVYDGSVSAPAGFVPAYSVSGLASGDTGATITNSGVAYDSAHVLGATKLTVSGLAFAGVTGSAGSQLGDYVLDASSKNIAAGISARTLTTTVSNTGLNKVYDGDSSAPAGFVPTYAITGFASGDTGATVLNTGAAYDSTHAGQASKITVSGLSVGAVAGSAGSLAGDYALDATSKIVAATIGARTLTAVLSNAAVSKVYDGTVAASGFVPAFTFSGLAGADTGATLNYASAQYNASHVATATALNVSGLSISAISGSGGALASDYALASASQSVAGTITARTVGLSAGKVYDGGVGLTGAVSVVTGIGGESLNYSGAAGSNANVAAAGKFVSAITLQDGAGASASDYQLPMLDAAHAALTITPKTVSLSAAKTYDGTASLAGAVSIATGVGGESLGYTGATASDANVATAAKYISAINLADGTGGSASNYALPVLAFAGAPVVINPFTVGLSGSRAYNGTTVAAAASLNLLALPQGQTLGLTGSGSFSDAHVGNGKAVSLGSLALTNGTGLASNYTLAGASATISVTKAQLTASASVANRTYDGTTGATINALTLSGFVAGETVNAVASGGASFASKDAGAGKTVTVSGIGLLDGSGLASDYSVAAVVTTTANIARANLNVAGVVALDKVYDGGNSASINSSGAVLTGRFGSDNVSVGSITGTFADKNVGTAKAITTGAFVLSGSDALNYNLIQPAGLTASITPRSLVVSATGVGKVYDATTSATVSLADNRIAGDVFTIASTASFLDKNVGVNKFVNVSGISLSGTDAGNYAVNSSGAAFATIGKAALTIGATAQSRVYNGGTAATVTLSDNRLGTDALTVTSGAATFADKNVGNAKVVSVGGISVSGADAGNYSFNTSAAGSANITPATLTVSASAAAKPYDSSAAATVTLSDNRIGGDSLTLARTGAAFNSASVGTAKPVSVTGISIASGADKGNYVLASTTAAATADITVVYDSWILPSDLPLTAAPVPVVPAPGANAPRISSALLLPLAPQLPAAGQATPLFRLDLPASFDTGADDDATTRTTPGQEDQEQQRKRAARALKVIEVAMAPPPAGR
ncbi:MAG: YDG domain-containing protein [Massilia sp.]